MKIGAQVCFFRWPDLALLKIINCWVSRVFSRWLVKIMQLTSHSCTHFYLNVKLESIEKKTLFSLGIAISFILSGANVFEKN